MQDFKRWLDKSEKETPKPEVQGKEETISLTKDEIINLWSQIDPNKPFQIEPIEKGKRGSNYDEDGIRITGSREFIEGILARIKDLIDYEGDDTRLNLVFRTIIDRETGIPKDSHVFYFQVRER